MGEYIIVNKESIQKRIEELESACIELFNLVHDSEGRIEYKIRANDLYDVAQHKEIKSTPLIPEIEKSFEAGRKLTVDGFEEEDFQDYEDYISNLKLDI